MNSEKILIAASVLFFYQYTEAQENTSISGKTIKVTEAYLQSGFYLYPSASLEFTEYEKLAPNSVLLNNDFSNFNSSSGFSQSAGNVFSASLGINFINKEKTAYKSNPQLRIGITHLSNIALASMNLNRSESYPVDTLTSSQNQSSVYIDSIRNTSYSMNHYSEQVRLDASLLFRTKPEARWSLFGGIGLTAGGSINSYTEIRQTNIAYLKNSFGNSSSSMQTGGNYESTTERFENKPNLGFSAYLPIGIDFRIGKNREFWKRMYLHYEIKAGIEVNSIPETGNITNSVTQNLIGLKIKV